MQCIFLLSACFVVASAVTLADFYHLKIAARRKSRVPLPVQKQFPGFKRYPAYTIDDDGHFFILPPAAITSTLIPPRASLTDLVPPELLHGHPKGIAPPLPDLPPRLRNEAFFINRRVYEIE
ncbi:hypothetical protein KIN20_004732 [Parelaphostrongylus tenuis]|uniref:Uncharacterized protein n=1 Tax=Parelaphostrongylus tenuis TaxID=148309 RepID=A0AAD5M273_PARTN|nr:hypothetical protein KIN20_004732 [Parelaphostrongylus tenuis]